MEQLETSPRAILSDLCRKAMELELDLQEIARRWPEGADDDRFLRVVRADLEDAVANVPRHFGEPCRQEWPRSDLYQKVSVDRELLRLERRADDLLAARAQLLAIPGLSGETVSGLVDLLRR